MSARLNYWTRGRTPVAALGCAVAACVLPLVLAVVLGVTGSGVGILGVLIFSVVVMAIGVAFGSVVVHAVACVLYGVAAIEATSSLGSAQRPVVLALVGAVLFVSFVLGELSSTVRRAPRVETAVWRSTALATAFVIAVAAGLAIAAYGIATLSVWPAIVLPVALLAIGTIVKLSTDRLT